MTCETTANDQVIKVRLVKGKPVADIDALRKYHREYYHATKQEVEREHCEKKCTSQSAYARHRRKTEVCLATCPGGVGVAPPARCGVGVAPQII